MRFDSRPLMLLALVAAASGCATARRSAAPWALSTDRPSISATPSVVPAGRNVIEAGATATVAAGTRGASVGETVWRRGLRPGAEMLVIVPSVLSSEAGGVRTTGLGDAGAGVRVALRESREGQSALAPLLSVLATSSIPTATNDLGAKEVQPSVLLLASWPLPRGLGLTMNAGWGRAEGVGDAFRTSAAVGLPLSPRDGVFAEVAGERTGQGGWARPLFTLGGTHLVSAQLQLDLFVRARSRPGGLDHALGAGFARLF